MLLGLYLSFTKWDILSPPTFIGPGNWADLLKDDLLWRAVLQTLYYAVASVAGATALSLALALALNQRLKTIGFYRTFFFLPAVTSLVAIAMVHGRNGFFLNMSLEPGKRHGIEFNLALLGMALALLVDGGGAISVDRMILRWLTR